MDGHGPIPPPHRAQPQQPPPMPPWPVPVPVGSVPAPRPPVDSWLPGFPDTEPPAGLPPYPGPPPHGRAARPARDTRPSTAASRSLVVAAVAVIGMLFASGVVALGYTVLNHAGFGASGRGPAIVVPESAAARPAPDAAPRPVAQTSPSTGTPSTGSGLVRAAGRTPGASPSVDPVYLAAMRQRPVFAGSTDADLYALGAATCGKLDSGQTFLAVVGDGGGRNLQPEDMGYLTGVSVMTYCPRHKPMLEQLIGRPLPTL